MADIKLYGADWCPTTRHAREILEQMGIVYDYINIDHDRRAARWVAEQNEGKEKKPTLDIKGQVLSAPSDSELMEVLEAQGISS
ncbi:MAG TPA: glutaredoxin family protein [Bryobacteraceae bacterium]|nr:glutaredoxin family protein [Bryobacteraceae bacterium]